MVSNANNLNPLDMTTLPQHNIIKYIDIDKNYHDVGVEIYNENDNSTDTNITFGFY